MKCILKVIIFILFLAFFAQAEEGVYSQKLDHSDRTILVYFHSDYIIDSSMQLG